MKYWEILSESSAGKAAMDYKRSNRYPDGTDIPESLPARYQPANFPGVPADQRCDNCGYYDTKTKKCDKFKGEPVVKPSYWCAKWEPMEEELSENFADGKNPQDKGDAKRHGINTKASVSSLRKTAKQGGRKGQLAHWLANMKAGKAKKK